MKKLTNKHARFKDAQWYGEELDIVQVGCGGIGSWLALLLSRMGDHSLYIYDMDTVDDVNYSGQLFNVEQNGMNKVAAISQTIRSFNDPNYTIHVAGKFDDNSFAAPILFLALDNMEARKLAYWKWREELEMSLSAGEDASEYLLVDGRLLAEMYQVITVTASNYKEYEEFLFGDEEVGDVMCSLKQTSHWAAIIAGRMVGMLTNFIVNRKHGEIRELPLFYSENGALLDTVVR